MYVVFEFALPFYVHSIPGSILLRLWEYLKLWLPGLDFSNLFGKLGLYKLGKPMYVSSGAVQVSLREDYDSGIHGVFQPDCAIAIFACSYDVFKWRWYQKQVEGRGKKSSLPLIGQPESFTSLSQVPTSVQREWLDLSSYGPACRDGDRANCGFRIECWVRSWLICLSAVAPLMHSSAM